MQLFSSRDGEALISIPSVGRYRIRNGRSVIVEPDPRADPALMRLFILGSVMGIMFHQRGLLALHASAVESGGEVLAFVGDQGQGKSTLAAQCLAGANRLVADDILVVSFDADGRPLAQPGMPGLKLWRDTLEHLGHGTDRLEQCWARAEKFRLGVEERVADRPLPLDRVYVLADDPRADAGRIAPMNGAAAAMALIEHTYRMELLDPQTERANHFAVATRLAGRIAVQRLTRNRHLAHLPDTAAMVLADAPRRELAR